jgi:hypothetical protein
MAMTGEGGAGRALHIHEPGRTPALSLFLGLAAMLPVGIGTASAWMLRDEAARKAATLTTLWGGSVLLFLAGVQRGLSFRTPGGPKAAQISTSLGLFALGLGAVALPRTTASAAALLAGYAAEACLDSRAARAGEAPLFFARFRPVQMLIPILSFAALILRKAVSD